MASGLFALLDDITTLLDDVAVLSKIAAKKTAGVVGDDLALNANQVAGVSADRELPVVWAVAVGSMKNKLILVPAALLISYFLPKLVIPLLMIGGAFLCFEGVEKILHKLLHSKADLDAEHQALSEAAANPQVDMVQFEKDKIQGAIRTDFILSAEILIIALYEVSKYSLSTQIGVMSVIAIAMTVGVYGLVAAIVKLDDVGLWLSKKADAFSRMMGRALLAFAPRLMSFLSFAGTAAMFLVGGGIFVHNIKAVHHWGDPLVNLLKPMPGGSLIGSMLWELIVGLIVGAICVAIFTAVQKLRGKKAGH